MAIPFLKCGFKACKEQSLAQGYPPVGEEPPSWTAVAMVNASNPFASPPTPTEGGLSRVR
ncbi:UNVERIFIED_CONTAM: hypothetical protein Sradi_2517400 [Sesamum radiatum]|uniref:Uncharacterized protein n=1 Tax=Sesamum radiatum TaxID=300843 RepID=A0AAW2SK86_SESRA